MSDIPVDVAREPNDVKFRVVQVADIVFDFAASTAKLVLREAEGARREITIPVALNDATTIFQAWKHELGRRPTSNELTGHILQEVHADVIATRIVKVQSGVYYAELDLMTPRGRKVFDARPSDAIAIALRQTVQAPLLIADDVLAQS
jgi:bifunctional DNase/RNase